jgi:hypothetical protein
MLVNKIARVPTIAINVLFQRNRLKGAVLRPSVKLVSVQFASKSQMESVKIWSCGKKAAFQDQINGTINTVVTRSRIK